MKTLLLSVLTILTLSTGCAQLQPAADQYQAHNNKSPKRLTTEDWSRVVDANGEKLIEVQEPGSVFVRYKSKKQIEDDAKAAKEREIDEQREYAKIEREMIAKEAAEQRVIDARLAKEARFEAQAAKDYKIAEAARNVQAAKAAKVEAARRKAMTPEQRAQEDAKAQAFMEALADSARKNQAEFQQRQQNARAEQRYHQDRRSWCLRNTGNKRAVC